MERTRTSRSSQIDFPLPVVLLVLLVGIGPFGQPALWGQLRASGNQVWTQVDLPDVTAEAGDGFGASMAQGDFNGDGFADLAIGAYREAVGTVEGAGVVHVLYGSEEGLSTAGVELWTQEDLGLGLDSVDSDYFGWRLESGDFDADAYDDLAIGIAQKDVGETSQPGLVVVLPGGSDGLVSASSYSLDQSQVGGELDEGGGFGVTLESCDLNGDSRDDLVIGAPWRLPQLIGPPRGGFSIVFGSGTGLNTSNSLYIRSEDLPVESTRSALGSGLACADFDADGDDDLAVRASSGIFGGSAIHLLNGSALVAIIPFTLTTLEAGDLGAAKIGGSLATGHLDDDPYADLIVSDFEYRSSLFPPSPRGGVAQLLFGSDTGLTTTDSYRLGQSSSGLEVEEDGDAYASGLAVADFDRDGIDDVALGGPGEDLPIVARGNENEDEGAVLVFPSTASGPTGSGAQLWTQGNLGRNAEADDRFGAPLEAGDFNGDGAADLAIGIASEDISTLQDAGAVLILYAVTPPIFDDGFESGDLSAWEP